MGICDKFKKLAKMRSNHNSEKLSDSTFQKQSAGENSHQLQVGTVVVNQGITEERARTVFTELIPQALQEYSQDAYKMANNRIEKLENAVMPRIIGIDNALTNLSDPAFQLLLRKAQYSAAATEREDDYSLLSELIVCQIQKGSDRKNRTGISKAIEIVGDIDGDALSALTVAHAVNIYMPTSGDMRIGLQVLNDLFRKLCYCELPSGMEWLDHLDVLGTLRISQVSSLKKFRDYYTENLNGYACVGIQVGSENYEKAIELLNSVGLNNSILQANELMDGYMRLPVINKAAITEMILFSQGISRQINDTEIKALEAVWDMYVTDNTLLTKIKDEFITVWDSYDALKKVRIWWEEIPCAFSLTKVGTVLAHTNAKRCDPNLPDLL